MNPVNHTAVYRFDKTVIIETQIIQHILVDVIKRKPLFQITCHHPARNAAADNIERLVMDMVGRKKTGKSGIAVHIQLPVGNVIDHGDMHRNNLPDIDIFRTIPAAQKDNMSCCLRQIR